MNYTSKKNWKRFIDNLYVHMYKKKKDLKYKWNERDERLNSFKEETMIY